MFTPLGAGPRIRRPNQGQNDGPTLRLRPLGNGFQAQPAGPTSPVGVYATNSGEPDCLGCSRWSSCHRDAKGYGKRCADFATFTTLLSLDDFDKIEDVAQPFAERAIRRNAQTFGDGVMSNEKIEDLLDQVLATAENASPVDFKIDDRDLPEAKNFFEFAVSKSFLHTHPYPKQIEIGLNLFSDFCPKCTNPKWLRRTNDHKVELDIPFDSDYVDYGEIQDNVMLLHHGVCPKCKMNKGEMWLSHGLKDLNELIGVAGQRAGKSWLVALLSAYTIHRYIKLQNPLRTFGLDSNGMLHATFTAIDLGQARRSIFTPLYNMASDSHWFREYHAMLDYYQNKFGEEIYHFKELSFGYNHRRLLIYPATPSKKGLRGATRFCGSIDELGWFFAAQKGSIKLDPDEVYSAMVNSFLTVRSAVTKLHNQGLFHVPPPLFCNVTSPSSARDKAMRLLKEVDKTVNIYGFHYASMQMNPSLDPRELQAIEVVDPSAFKRDFLAQPPDATNPFIQNKAAAEKVARPKFKNKVIVDQTTANSKMGAPMTTATIRIANSVAVEEKVCVLALDAGEKDNSFAAAIVSLQEQEDAPDSVVIEAMFEIIPKVGYPINFNALYTNVLIPLFDKFDIRYVAADRWQSKKLLEDLEEEVEVAQTQYSLKYEDFMDFRNAIYNGLIKAPKAEMDLKEAYLKGGTREYPHNFMGMPVSHFQSQLITVEDNFGKTVSKGEKMTDDLFRAVVLGYSMITDREVQEMYLIGEPDRSQRGATLGVVGSYSGVSGISGGNTGVEGGVAAMGSFMHGGGGPASIGGAGGATVFSGNRR